ncbi:MAG: hypothetical protein IBX68_03525 [Dehalococcoidia bacterium]|nr:hypothetical protein [Dehalococcoidia bacterium]
MNREEIFRQVKESTGAVPDWLAAFPDSHLEHIWAMISWMSSDSRLTSQEKALIGFGAAASVHCPY